MPNTGRLPEMWTMGSATSLISIGAVVVLFLGFLAVSMVRHFGLQALVFAGAGAAMMIGLALVVWLQMKQRSGGRRG